MSERGEIYQCLKCGNIIEVLVGEEGVLTCCSQPMQQRGEKIADATLEKHMPFIQKEGDKYLVRIGENTEHPREEKHYIQWIEILWEEMILRKYLTPAAKSQAEFVSVGSKDVTAREHCSPHGLWISKV